MKQAKPIALGGMLGALAMVIMCLGGLIPVSTYICPILCMLLLRTVLLLCGKRIAWAWYAMVAILSLLMGPDKEAAALMVLLGYYPIIKSKIDKMPLPLLWKLLFFNVVILFMYTAVVYLLGLEQVIVEASLLGYLGLAAMVILGNATFFLLDILLHRFPYKYKKRGR